MKLKKGTLLFLLLTCLAYTTLAQTEHILKYEDITIDDGVITACSYDFGANIVAGGTKLTIPKSVKPINGAESQTIIIKGIGDQVGGVFGDKNLVSVEFASDSEVTTIRNFAFRNNKIGTLDLPTTLTTIGESAFENNSITTLDLSNLSNLTTFDRNAFQNNQITTLRLPPSITSIGWGAFRNNQIANLDLSDLSNLTTFDRNAFQNNQISTLKLSPSITSIGWGAFENNQITALDLADLDNLTTIEWEAFLNNQISTLKLSPSITSIGLGAFAYNQITDLDLSTLGNLTTIGQSAFRDNEITTLKLPPAITSIGPIAFQDNQITALDLSDLINLTTIEWEAFLNNQISTLRLPPSITTIKSSAFAYNQITTLKLPPALATIGECAFKNNQITALDLSDLSNLTTIGGEAFQDNQISTLRLPPTITSIGNNTFENNEISELNLPSSISTIGAKAFSENKLTSVTFETDSKSQLSLIGHHAFSGNTSSLLGIVLPQSGVDDFNGYRDHEGTDYDAGATFSEFHRTLFASYPHTLTDDDVTVVDGIITNVSYSGKMSSLTIPETLDKQTIIGIGEGTFEKRSIKSLTLPSTLTSIGNNAFQDNQITTISLTSSISDIGESAFSGNILTSLDLAELTKLENVKEEAFAYNQIADLILPPNLTTIEDFAFLSNILTTLDLSALTSLDTINWGAFAGNKIADLILPPSIATIGNFAFSSNILTTLDLSALTSLDTINRGAFAYNQIADLILPPSITTIGESAFQDNEILSLDLSEVTALETIGENAFTDNNEALNFIPLPLKQEEEGKRCVWRQTGGQFVTEIKDFASSYNYICLQKFVIEIGTENNQEFVADDQVGYLGREGGGYFGSAGLHEWIHEKLKSGDNWIDTTAFFPDYTLKAVANAGYEFVRWEINNTPVESVQSSVLDDGGITVRAYFKESSLTNPVMLTVAKDGEGKVTPAEGKYRYEKNTDVTLTATPDEGWKFDKWVITGGEDENGDPITLTVVDVTVDANKTATAHFVQRVTLTLTIVETEASSQVSGLNAGENKIDKGADFELKATPASGQKFVSWTIGEETIVNNPYTLPVTQADISVTVTFEAIPLEEQITFTLAIEGQGSTTPKVGEHIYEKGTTAALTAEPADSWRFDKWVIAGEDKNNNPTDVTVDADKTATAHFVQQVTLNLTIVETEASGVVSGLNAGENKIDKGADFELKATPASGQRFASWTIGEETIVNNPYTLPATQADISVTVTFEAIPLEEQITFTLAIEGQGSTTPKVGEHIYEKGTTAALTAEPADSWRFDKWVIAGEDKNNNPTDVTVDADKTATAHFVQLVTLTTSVEGQQGGTISATPKPSLEDNQYDINTEVELTATPNEGWKFDKWVISDEQDKTDEVTTITLDKNKSVTAHFVKEEAITSIFTEVVSATPYPNPVTSQITLKAKDGDLIQLFSQKGKQQYSTQYTGNEVHTIDVSAIPVGVYLVRITDAEGNTTTKRIVKK